MTNIKKFSINIEGILEDDFYKIPEDPLGEFSDFEMAFRRFCFDNNLYIAIIIGNVTHKIHLYHDFLDAIEDGWCKDITKLSNGETITIDLNDFNLYMTPNLNVGTIECRCHSRFGTSEPYNEILSLSDVLEQMNYFTNKILTIAVQKGYINTEDIYKYLGRKLCIDS